MQKVAAINHSFADPTPYVAPAHASGVRVFAQVQTVAQARRAAQAGVDVIIAQGTEAGGHTGLAGTPVLVPAVVDAVGGIPVVAAGGIADGRGLAAVLLLGAMGGWLGARFVASHEWAIVQMASLVEISPPLVDSHLVDIGEVLTVRLETDGVG